MQKATINNPPEFLVSRWYETGVPGNQSHQYSQPAVERKTAIEKLNDLKEIQERQIAMKLTKSLGEDMTMSMSQSQHQLSSFLSLPWIYQQPYKSSWSLYQQLWQFSILTLFLALIESAIIGSQIASVFSVEP